MRFLVDAQLPVRLARFLTDAGHDVAHTSELPEGNRTTDARIAEVADGEGRVVDPRIDTATNWSTNGRAQVPMMPG